MEAVSIKPHPTEDVWLPLAAILCISIVIYVLLIAIGLGIRKCLLKKGVCSGECPSFLCCDCAAVGLRCAEACDCCPARLSCYLLLDYFCPEKLCCDQSVLDCCPNLECCTYCNWGGECNSRCATCSENCTPFASCVKVFGYCGECATCCQSCCGDCCLWCQDYCILFCGSDTCCECNACSCTCTQPECSSINCFCCEITIKGMET